MTLRTQVTLDETIDYLNDLIEMDRVSVAVLTANVPCSWRLAGRPTVRVYARRWVCQALSSDQALGGE